MGLLAFRLNRMDSKKEKNRILRIGEPLESTRLTNFLVILTMLVEGKMNKKAKEQLAQIFPLEDCIAVCQKW